MSGFIVGCGGGSSSDTPVAEVTDDQTVIAGTAEAPATFQLALREQGTLQLASDFIFSPAAAAIRGTGPLPGKTVELIKVDSNGNQVGDVLESVTTGNTGNYELIVPDSIDPDTDDLAVRISGPNGVQLRALVINGKGNIKPSSEFVVRKSGEKGAVADLSASEVQTLVDSTEDFDIDLENKAPEDAFGEIEKNSGDFVKGSITKLTTPPASAVSLLGNYNYVNFQMTMIDRDNNDFGEVGSDLGISEIKFEEQETGELSAGAVDIFGANAFIKGLTIGGASVTFNANENITPGVEVTQLAPDFGSFRGNGVLYVGVPRSVNAESVLQIKSPRLIALQKSMTFDLFHANSVDQAGLFNSTIVDEAEQSAPPLSAKIGDERQIEFNAMLRQTTNATKSDLSGTFGQVAFRPGFSEGLNGNPPNISVSNSSRELKIDPEQGILYTGNRGSLAAQRSDGSIVAGSEDKTSEILFEGVDYNVSDEGIFTIVGLPDFNAVVDESFNFFFGGTAVGTSDNTGSDNGGIRTSMAVKLGAEVPDLNSRQYKVTHIAFGFGENGEIRAIGSRDDATMTFNSQTSGTFAQERNLLLKTNGLAGDVTFETLSQELTVSANGPVDPLAEPWTLALGDGIVAEGYFSESGDLGIFRTLETNQGDLEPETLGLMIMTEMPNG